MVRLPCGVVQATGFDVPVQDHAAYGGGEQVGVGGAQPGAVGQAHIVEHSVADGFAQQVHVAGHVGGGVVVEKAAAVSFGAPGVEPGVGLFPRCVLLRADGERRQRRQERLLRRDGREAAHRGAEAEAARVEGDDVKTLPHWGGEPLVSAQEALDLLVGAAAVDEQRADALRGISGEVPDHRDADLRAVWVPVIQRHPRLGALEAVIAGSPVQHRNPRRSHRGRTGLRRHARRIGRSDGEKGERS